MTTPDPTTQPPSPSPTDPSPLPDPMPDPVVLGLPRGGVVVAAEVAAALGAPLDVVLVRKLGLPGQPELAMGAIAAAGEAVETVRTPVATRGGEAAFAAVREREL